VRELSVGLCGSGALAVPLSLVTGTASARTGRKTCCRLLYHLSISNETTPAKAWNVFTESYTSYDPGSLESSKPCVPVTRSDWSASIRIAAQFQCSQTSLEHTCVRCECSYELVFNSCIAMGQKTQQK
jgi:hypothetical protein